MAAKCASCHFGSIGSDFRCQKCGWLDRAAQHDAENPAAAAALLEQRRAQAVTNRHIAGLDVVFHDTVVDDDNDWVEIGVPDPAPAPTVAQESGKDTPMSRSVPNKWGAITVTWSSGHQEELMADALDDPDAEWDWLRALLVK